MPNFPESFDDDVSLYLAVNNARTRLTSTISISDLTIPVVTTSGFPNQGFLTILTNPDDITEAEAIRYEGLTPTTFSGVERGAGGTFPYVHAVGNFVDLTVMAEHHNELKDAIIALEHVTGVSGSHNFVPKDEFGNAIVSGTLTITEDGDANVCGPATFKDDVYFATNTLVSGTATFGVIPASTVPEAYTAFDDVGGTGTGNGFTAQLSTDPLPAGDNLILYRGNVGWDPTSTNTGQLAIRTLFAGLEIGLGEGNTAVKAGHGHGAEVAGFKVVTGDGVNSASLQTRSVAAGASRIYQWGAAGLVSIPLGEMGLVENTDYWYDNGLETAQTTSSTTMATFNTLNFTVPDAGDYVFFFTTEMDAGIQSRTRFRMDGTVVFSQAETGQSGERAPGAGAVVVSLTAGAHTATFQQSCNNAFASSSDTYRSRMFVLRAASFSQVQFSRSATDQATATSVFTQLSNVGSITHVPAQEEQVLILGTAGHFSSNDDTSASYQITNTTDAESYAIDSGTRVGNNASEDVDNRQSFFFRTLDDVSLQKDFEIQHRRYTGGSTTTTTDAALVVLGLSQPVTSTDVPVTTILGNTITTHEIIADVITTTDFSTTNVTVTGILDVTEGTTYLGQTFAYNLSANDLTASGTLTVSGTSCFADDVDFKGNITVSGTAKFGQDDTPPASTSSIISVSQETEQTTNSTSLVSANCETAPLLDGVEYLIIYSANTGNASVSRATDLNIQFGGSKVGGGQGEKSAMGTFGNNHYNGNIVTGIYKATGNGTSTLRFMFHTTDAAQTAYAGAMSIICIPLDTFTQNTDYYYEATPNSDTNVVTNAPIQDPPNTALTSNVFSGMAAGDWLFMWSQETTVGNSTGRAFLTRFQVDGNTVGPSRYGRYNTNGSNNVFTFTGANVVNIPTGGNITADILVSSIGASEADSRRGRVFAINTALFTQVLSNTDSSGFKTSSSSFQDFVGLSTTITPTNVDSPVIVFTSATAYTTDTNTSMTSAIRNETDGIDYRVDSGDRSSSVGGTGVAGLNLSNNFMAHTEERTSATEYRYQIRSSVSGDVAVGRNENDDGGELSEMIVWEFVPVGTPFIPITQTCIDDDEIQTGTMIADTITARQELTVSGVPVNIGPATIPDPLNVGTVNAGTISGTTILASESLTISGVPVSTGTVNTSFLDDRYVNEDGDIMSGNLDMAGNNIYNAGVVAMQDDTPTITTSGLLWFDTDAPGHGTLNLPGGFFGSRLTMSSGTSVADTGGFLPLAFDVEEYDTGGFFNLDFDKRLTVPSGVTHVQLAAGVRFDANAVGDRRLTISRNSEGVLGGADQIVTSLDDTATTGASPYVVNIISPVLTVSGGDFFTLNVRQTSGGPLTVNSILAADTFFSIAAIDTRGIPGVNTVNLLQGDINIVPASGITVTANSQSNTVEIGLAEPEFQDLQVWSPDAPPASGTSFDSEWGVDGLGTTGWTEWDVGGFLTVSTLPRARVLRLKHTATGANVAGLIKAAPASNFTLFTKIFVMENTARDFKEFGIVLSDDLLGSPSTANFAVITLPFHEDGTDVDASYLGFATQHFTDYNSFDRNLDFSAVHFPANEPIYVKVHVDVTTRVVSASASRDGLIWGAEITSDFSGDLTNITEMGYWINNSNATSPLVLTSDFFRVVENVDHSAPLRGNFLTVSGVPQAIVVVTGTETGGGSGDGNITDINAQEGPSVTITGAGIVDVITDPNLLTISGSAITGINIQSGPEITISGAGSVEVTTTADFITVSGSSAAGGLTDVNAQTGPSITITGTAGIGVITAGNVITIDGTEVQGSGGTGVTISGCYTHYQSSASATWNITHNLGSTPVNYIVLDNANTEVIPNTFTVDDSNSVTITFVAPQAGRADIFPCVSGTAGIGITEGTATVSGCYSHVQTVSTGTWTVDHDLNTEMVNYVVLDNSGSQVQPDDFTIVDENQITLDFVTPRVGIANIFACVDDEVTFNGGVFSNVVAVTGTFLNGLTVGTGTTYITGSGIDTPELKINGQSPSFGGGGGLEFISATVPDGNFIPVEFPTGYRRFELHIVNFRNSSGVAANITVRQKTEDTPSFFSTQDAEGVVHAVRSNDSTPTSVSVADSEDRSFATTSSQLYLVQFVDDTWRIGIGADDKLNGILNVVQVGDASNYPQYTWDVTYVAGDGRQTQVIGAARRIEKSRCTGLQFQINTNGAIEGTVYLYGYPE